MKPTQEQLYWNAERRAGVINETFLDAVRDGLTRRELVSLIAKRPMIWERFSNWLDKLPA